MKFHYKDQELAACISRASLYAELMIEVIDYYPADTRVKCVVGNVQLLFQSHQI